jgi:hypothetical protein
MMEVVIVAEGFLGTDAPLGADLTLVIERLVPIDSGAA